MINAGRKIVASLILIAVSGCGQVSIPSPSSPLALSERIEEEAESLRWSSKADSSVSYQFRTDRPWVLMFLPRSGFNEDKAQQAGVQDELRRAVEQRVKEWPGSALIVFARPRDTSIAKLPNAVDVREQLILRGDAGNVNVAIGLSRAADKVSISSATPQP